MAKKASLFFLTLALPLSLLSFSCGNGGGGTEARIKKDKRIYIGAVPFEPPLLYQDRQELVGPEAELAKRISDKIGGHLGVETEPFWITRSYNTLPAALLNDEIDFIVSVFGITDARREEVLFSDPYYESEMVLVINPSHQGDLKADSLAGKKIGVREGTAFAEQVADKYSQSTLVPHTTLDDAILALKRAEIDAVIDDRYMAAFSLATTPGVAHLEIVPGTLGTVSCGAAVRKEDTDLMEQINQVIAEIKKESLYAQWTQEHMGADRLAKVESRYEARMERLKMATQPRRVLIRLQRSPGSSFDIYRFANLSFVLTNSSTGQAYQTSRIDFQGATGTSGVRVPPGEYRVFLPKFNFSPGYVLIRDNDPDQVNVRIRLRNDGAAEMTRS